MSSDTPPHLPAVSSGTQPHVPIRSARRRVMPLLSIAVVIGVIVLIAGVVLVINLLHKTPVTVILDGEAFQHDTRAATVANLLDDLDLVLDERDLVSPSPESTVEAGMVLRVNRARPVSLTIDGQTSVLWTPLSTPAEILDSINVTVSEQDVVELDGTTALLDELAQWPVPVSRMSVRHAVRLHVDDNGEERTLQTTGGTVGDALFQAGIPLYLADMVSVDLNTPITPDLEVNIARAKSVSITADGMTIETRTQGETVADALADAGIALMGLDYSVPAEDELLGSDTDVRVVRVKEEVITETQTIPNETIYQASAEMETDQSAVIEEGQPGIQQTITRIRYEDGVEVSRSTSEPTVLRPAVDRVIAYGTNVVIRTIDTPDGPRSYTRVLRLYATSYHPEALGGDSTTATGRTLQHGIVAADTSILPFGTEVYVPGYGIGVVQDTAPPRRGGMWIDLGYSDADYRHWSRDVDVYVLLPVESAAP